jgi:hypothetical protein
MNDRGLRPLQSATPHRSIPMRLIGMALLLLSISGCRGCDGWDFRKKAADAKDKKDPNQRLEIRELLPRPSIVDRTLVLKPGHWIEARLQTKALLQEENLLLNTRVTERTLRPLALLGSMDFVDFQRQAVFAQGQLKEFDLQLYLPDLPNTLTLDETPLRPSIQTEFVDASLGGIVGAAAFPANIAPAEQFQLIVWSSQPDRNAFWPGLSCVVWPAEGRTEAMKVTPHRVVEITNQSAAQMLPSRCLFWTSASHIVFYDADPTQLTEAQLEAMEQWLYFGGQWIVSGPDALAGIFRSPLARHLPMQEVQSGVLDQETWEPFLEAWSVSGNTDKEKLRQLPESRRIVRLQGDLVEGANWVQGAEGIIAEKRVGKGRVVLSTVPLSEEWLVRWSGISSFVNGALLGHPPRAWVIADGLGELRYSDLPAGDGLDPRFTSTLRFLGRDLGMGINHPSQSYPQGIRMLKGANITAQRDASESNRRKTMQQREASASNTLIDPDLIDLDEERPARRSPASWNDASPLAEAATDTLLQSSGNPVPRLSLVASLLAGYLLVLVPLNWLVFWWIRRLELAWVAAPILAVLGAGVVFRLVHLDVGMTTRRYELGLLEGFANQPVAHHTAFHATFTSLANRFRITYPDNRGVVLPYVFSEMRRDGKKLTYNTADSEGNGLVPFPINSSSSDLFHSEEVLTLDGGLDAEQADSGSSWKLTNRMSRPIQGLAIFGRSKSNQLESAWIGDLDAGASCDTQLESENFEEGWMEGWDKHPATSRSSSEEDPLPMANALKAILEEAELPPGAVVAIGWIDQSPGHLVWQPDAPTPIARTILFFHLKHPPAPPARPDASLPAPTTPDPVSE